MVTVIPSSDLPSSSSAPPSISASSELTHLPLADRRLYLAVDCGGTKAAAAISVSSATPGGLPVFLSRGFGGAANYTDVGLWRFLKSVRHAVEDALDNADIQWRQESTQTRDQCRFHRFNDEDNLEAHSSCSSSSLGSPQSPSSSLDDSDRASSSTLPSSQAPSFSFPPIFYAAWLGVAGVDSPSNVSVLSPHLARLLSIPYPSSRLIVANDTSLLASPVMERDGNSEEVKEGVVVIAGTGSIVMSFRSCKQPRAQEGHDLRPRNGGDMLEAVGRVGGFGWLLGDEAGGYMVGRQAIRVVLDQADQENLALDDEEVQSDDDDEEDEETPEQQEGRDNDALAESTLKSSSSLDALSQESPDVKHLLRDHILRHWNLSSVGELLDAVYSDSPALPERPSQASLQASPDSSRASSESGRSETNRSGSITGGLLSLKMCPTAAKSTESSNSTTLYLQSVPQTPATEASISLDCRDSGPCLAIPSSLSLVVAGQRTLVNDEVTSLTYGHPLDATYGQSTTCALSGEAEYQEHQGQSSLHPRATSHSSTHKSSSSTLGARKSRLASLAPLVFDLAFNQGDELSLEILRREIRELAGQIELLLARPVKSKKQKKGAQDLCGMTSGGISGRRSDKNSKQDGGKLVQPHRSVLCLGGSLLGVPGYRQLLVDELKSRGWEFQRVVHVEDVARRGCEALAKGWEANEGRSESVKKEH